MELLFWGIWFWNNSNAKSVYVTDFNPTTVENLKHNISLNGDRFEEKDSSSQADFSTERVHASAIDWDDESTWPNEKLDIVIGSDLIYQSTIVPLLHKAVKGLLNDWALYLFNEQVSDATFKALFEVSAGNTSNIMMDSFSDITWNSRRGELARKENELSAELMEVDAEDIVVSGSSRTATSLSAVFDLGDDDHFDAGSVPPELMNAAFRSKLFLVWDPSRTSGKIAFDVHSGAHVPMNFNNVQPWRVEGAKDVIDSIGGVQHLLKLFDVLIGNDKGCSSSQRIDETHPQTDAESTPRYYIDENIQSLIPPLLNLLASFLNDHSDNAREMLRCGGIEIIERSLLRNKLERNKEMKN